MDLDDEIIVPVTVPEVDPAELERARIAAAAAARGEDPTEPSATVPAWAIWAIVAGFVGGTALAIVSLVMLRRTSPRGTPAAVADGDSGA